MSEKKLLVIDTSKQATFKFIRDFMSENKFIKEATEQDLRELGWVKAEPTDCSKCKHYRRSQKTRCYYCDKHKNEDVPAGCEGFVICLDSVPRNSGKQEEKVKQG